jgi:hypothetical protein
VTAIASATILASALLRPLQTDRPQETRIMLPQRPPRFHLLKTFTIYQTEFDQLFRHKDTTLTSSRTATNPNDAVETAGSTSSASQTQCTLLTTHHSGNHAPIAGVVIGVFVHVAAMAGGLILCKRRQSRKLSDEPHLRYEGKPWLHADSLLVCVANPHQLGGTIGDPVAELQDSYRLPSALEFHSQNQQYIALR